MTTRWRSALVSTLASSLLLTACQSASTQATPTQATPTQATISAPASASASHEALAGCPPAQPFLSLTVLAHTDISPDDMLAMPDGTIWVSDPDSGHIEHLAADGHLLLRTGDVQAPEGMVAVGTAIVLAEQRLNRVVSFTAPSTTRTTLLTLPARGSQDGVDGIGLDTVNQRLLIPDSPHGTLLSAATDGTGVRTLATGLGRDVAAAIGPDGAIWVAVEGDRGLLRVPLAGGAATPVGGTDLVQLDDVVAVGSLLYVTLLTAGEVVAVDPSTGADHVLVNGARSLQGLALLANGRLALADSSNRVIATLAPCTAG